jgi:hypothetical protein
MQQQQQGVSNSMRKLHSIASTAGLCAVANMPMQLTPRRHSSTSTRQLQCSRQASQHQRHAGACHATATSAYRLAQLVCVEWQTCLCSSHPASQQQRQECGPPAAAVPRVGPKQHQSPILRHPPASVAGLDHPCIKTWQIHSSNSMLSQMGLAGIGRAAMHAVLGCILYFSCFKT